MQGMKVHAVIGLWKGHCRDCCTVGSFKLVLTVSGIVQVVVADLYTVYIVVIKVIYFDRASSCTVGFIEAFLGAEVKVVLEDFEECWTVCINVRSDVLNQYSSSRCAIASPKLRTELCGCCCEEQLPIKICQLCRVRGVITRIDVLHQYRAFSSSIREPKLFAMFPF